MAVALRYFTEFGKHVFQHITAASICGGMHASIVFVVRVRCRTESSRSLSHLLMSSCVHLCQVEMKQRQCSLRVFHYRLYLITCEHSSLTKELSYLKGVAMWDITGSKM